MKTLCWNCQGNEVLVADCDTCEGTGAIDEPRLHVISRRRPFLGRSNPGADRNGNEKWVRLSVEVPPEIAAELDRIGNEVWRGHTVKRSSITRAALLYWMNHHDPEPDAPLEATAEEVFARLEITDGTVEESDDIA